MNLFSWKSMDTHHMHYGRYFLFSHVVTELTLELRFHSALVPQMTIESVFLTVVPEAPGTAKQLTNHTYKYWGWIRLFLKSEVGSQRLKLKLIFEVILRGTKHQSRLITCLKHFWAAKCRSKWAFCLKYCKQLKHWKCLPPPHSYIECRLKCCFLL